MVFSLFFDVLKKKKGKAAPVVLFSKSKGGIFWYRKMLIENFLRSITMPKSSLFLMKNSIIDYAKVGIEI